MITVYAKFVNTKLGETGGLSGDANRGFDRRIRFVSRWTPAGGEFRAGRGSSLQAAAGRKRPHGFHDAVPDSVEFIVQDHRRIGVTRHEFDGFAHFRVLSRGAELDFSVLGGQDHGCDVRDADRLRNG